MIIDDGSVLGDSGRPIAEADGPAEGPLEAKELPLLESYAGSTVLITGGTGFIGSALTHSLSKIACRIVLLFRPGRRWDSIPSPRAEIISVYGDIKDRDTWLKALQGVDYVFHFAAQTSGYTANKEPLSDLQINLVPVLQMLEACREGDFHPKILFAGTVTQAGLTQQCPVNEDVQDLPLTIYDIHKLAGEKYFQYYAKEVGIPSVTLRIANVYGPGSSAGGADRGVLNLMIRNGLNDKALTVYDDGTQVRDYVFIDDVVRAFLTAGTKASTLSGNFYVIGSGRGYRIVDVFNLVAERIQDKTGRSPAVMHVPAPKPQLTIEERNFVADSKRFYLDTGWEPQVQLPDGIDRTIEYFVKQEDSAAVNTR